MKNTLLLGGSLTAIGVALLTLIYVSIGAGQIDEEPAQEQRLRLANLAGACESSIGQDGFGTFELDRQVIVRDEEGEIQTPCKIRILSGGGLAFENVTLRTRNLAILDVGANGKSQVRVEDSSLSGAQQSGFFARLSDPADTFEIHRSTLDYPLSFWAVVQGRVEDGPDGGRIDITDSEIRSLDPDSEGIQLIASDDGGTVNATGLTLTTVEWDPNVAPGVQNALLIADSCQLERVEGYSGICALNGTQNGATSE